MFKLQRPSTVLTFLATFGLFFLAASFYFASAGAEDRAAHTDLDGPLPADQVPEAPPVILPAAQQPVLVATFDEQPTDWEVEQRTYFPYEFGIWESTANKLAQSGSEEGQSLVETFLLAPPQVGTEAFIGTQIYPQGNQVIGILFGFTENGYYAYRVYRNAPHDPQRPGQLHLLEYYDATTMDYRVIAEKTTADGIPGFETGSWQELRVSLSGDRIRTSFHGTDVFDVEETQLREGKVGLLTLAIGEVLFDNFTVAQP